MRRWIWIILLVGVVGLTAWGLMRPRAEQGLSVNVAQVQQGEFVREVRANGTVEAKIYTLSFPRVGRVAEVRVKEGQSVSAGQVLAVLESTNERQQLASAQQTLLALQSRIRSSASDFQTSQAKLQSQLTEAQRSLALSRRLLELGSVARNEVEQQQRQVGELQNQLATLSQSQQSTQRDLEAQSKARQTEIAALERTIILSTLKAPVAGSVATVGYLVGVDSGGSGVRLVEAGSLQIQARLSETDIALVRPGQPVRVELDSAPAQPLQAKVGRLGVQAEVSGSGGSAVLPIFIRLLDPKAESLARPGLSATNRITTLRLPQALKVPLECLVEEKGQTFVWKIDPTQKTVRKTPITLQARNLTHAAVEGLSSGDTLVSLPPEELKEGGKVSYVLKEPSP